MVGLIVKPVDVDDVKGGGHIKAIYGNYSDARSFCSGVTR